MPPAPVPVSVTVLELAVNVPELDQLPVKLNGVVVKSAKVPAVIVTFPVMLFEAPDKFNAEVLLFSISPVTLLPMAALIVTVPVPLPELVTVPILLTAVVITLMAPAVELLFWRIRFPEVLATPPERVSTCVPREFIKVVPTVVLGVSAPLIVKAEVVLASVMDVTFAPIGALIVTPPLPVPELVIVPVILIAVVEKVSAPEPLV